MTASPTAPAQLVGAQQAFRDELLAAGVLTGTAVPGVYGRSGLFESIVEAIQQLVAREGDWQHLQRFRFPPILDDAAYQHTDHLLSFPHLVGAVRSFDGTEREAARMVAALGRSEDWGAGLEHTSLVMTAAACHPVYRLFRGVLPDDGATVDVTGWCYRHEPSPDPARMQSFRQSEFVRIGTPEQAREHWIEWVNRSGDIVARLGLTART